MNPGNDPESMVAFLPNVRRNTTDKVPDSAADLRERFIRSKKIFNKKPLKGTSWQKLSLDELSFVEMSLDETSLQELSMQVTQLHMKLLLIVDL